MNYKLTLLLIFSCLSFAVFAQDSNEVEKVTVIETAPAVQDSLTDTEVEEFSDTAGGLIAFIKDAKANYDIEKPKGVGGVLAWLFTFLIAALAEMKLVQLTRSFAILKKYFYKVPTENIVKGVSLLVALGVTLLSNGGNFVASNFAAAAVIVYLLADVIYQVLKRRGLVNKTPKAETA